MIEDITERINAETALSSAVNELRKSEAEQKAMLANNSDVISIIDQNGHFKYVSPNIKKIFGWNVSDVQETYICERIHPDDIETANQRFMDLLNKDNGEEIVELRYKCSTGDYKIVEIIAKNLINDPDINGILLNLSVILP